MLPACLFTVSTPSATVHPAAPLSRTDCHWSRSVPLNSTIASDGGAASVAPGVTIFGTGSQTSVSAGLPRAGWGWPGRGACCAAAGSVPAVMIAIAKRFGREVRMRGIVPIVMACCQRAHGRSCFRNTSYGADHLSSDSRFDNCPACRQTGDGLSPHLPVVHLVDPRKVARMRKLLCVLGVVVSFVRVAPAYAQALPTSQPNYLQITIEEVKVGHDDDHSKLEAGWPAAFEKAKSPYYGIGMVAMTGAPQAWFITPYDSNKAIGESMKANADDPVLAA